MAKIPELLGLNGFTAAESQSIMAFLSGHLNIC